MPILVFYVTHADESAAQNVVSHLLTRRLIACANIFPIQAAYVWQSALVHEAECVSLLKTRPELASIVEQEILNIHPYTLPCIVRYEARANEQYEQWIFEQTASESL
jgi:periplasmic divalent cation tolerance protein